MNIRVVIPTGQGDGAERLARSYHVWGKLLKTNFEYNFYPGAAGQVGHERSLGLLASRRPIKGLSGIVVCLGLKANFC
jgi:hypothetical protein